MNNHESATLILLAGLFFSAGIYIKPYRWLYIVFAVSYVAAVIWFWMVYG